MTPWTKYFMEFSRPENVLDSLSLLQGIFPTQGSKPRSPALRADSLPAEPQGKPKDTGLPSLSLLQLIFPTQESNRCFLHSRQIPYQLSYQGTPTMKVSSESHRLGGLNNRNQFSYSSGAWKSKIWVQGLLWDTFWLALLHHVSISQREEEIFFICLPYKAVVLSE